MLREYKAPYNLTQQVAAMIIDENNNLIAKNFKSLDSRTILHAEQRVLEEAGEKARGKILITTLEPCTWRKSGKSCSELIVEAGISKVVYGYEDQNQPICAKDYLKEAGIDAMYLKEYRAEIAKITNSYIGNKKEKRIKKAKEKEEIYENQKERKRLKAEGKLGYHRPEEKRNFNQILRKYVL